MFNGIWHSLISYTNVPTTCIYTRSTVPGKVSGRSLPSPAGHILWRATYERKTHYDQKTEFPVIDFGATFSGEEKKWHQPAGAAGRPPVCSGRDCTPENKQNKQHQTQMLTFLRKKGTAYFPPLKCHLYRAGHCAEGEHSSTVLYGGLAVKSSLSVAKEHSHLLRKDAINKYL